jgi:hypothetical protein
LRCGARKEHLGAPEPDAPPPHFANKVVIFLVVVHDDHSARF